MPTAVQLVTSAVAPAMPTNVLNAPVTVLTKLTFVPAYPTMTSPSLPPALQPIAVFLKPVVPGCSALMPIEVFQDPVVLAVRELSPTAVLAMPLVLVLPP